MARKKLSVESITHQDHQPHEVSSDPCPDKKMDNLRTLNQFLLKETKEKRFVIENLKSQIEELNEEKLFLFDFEREISRLVISSTVAEEIKNLGGLVRERDGIKKALEAAVADRDASQEEVRLRRKEIGELETRVRVLESLREVMEAEREEMSKRHRAEMELNVKKVSTLEGKLRCAVELKVEELRLRSEVAELGERNGLVEGEIVCLRKKAGVLEKEKKELETQLRVSSLDLDGARVKIGKIEWEKEGLWLEIMELKRRNGEVDMLQVNVDLLLKEKDEIGQAKANLEMEILQLKNKVKNLNSCISELQELSTKYAEKNSQLQTHRDATDDTERELDIQLEESGRLKLQVEELTKSREGMLQALKKIQVSFNTLVSEKQEGNRVIELLEKRLSASQSNSRDLERKMKAAELTSGKALSLLKSTVEAMNGSEKDQENGIVVIDVIDVDDDDEICSLESEMESIKTAYSNRVAMIEEMSRELEVMKLAVDDEGRKKGGLCMWLLYPATSAVLAAAISFVYAAKTR